MTIDDNALDRRLAALKQELSQLEAPADVGRRLDAAIAAARAGKERGAQTRWHVRESWLFWPLALAATIGVITWTLRTPRDSGPPEVPAAATPAATQFIPLVPIDDIAQTRGAYVVSTPMPRTMLAELGLPVSPARAAEPIESELLVRADGTVLAVRFLQ